MVAAVMTTRNEAGIIGPMVHHLLDQGVSLVLVADASSDGTREVLSGFREAVEWREDNEPCHRQQYWVDLLAAEAHERGATWILPTDADEFWLATSRQPLAKVLAECPASKLYAQLWHHLDPDRKYAEPERLPKVAYRWSPGAHIGPGNHDVSLPDGVPGLLEIRHYQYQGFEHYCRKVRERNATLAPRARARGDGAHHTRLEGASDDELRAAWEELTSKETVHDPIPPFHGGHGLDAGAP